MSPYTANGTFTAILSETDRKELEAQRDKHRIWEADASLGRYTNNPNAVANDPVGRSLAAVRGLYETSEGLQSAIDKAATHKDSNLTPEALRDVIMDKNNALGQALQGRIAALGEHLDDAYLAANTAAAPFRPKFDPESVAQVSRIDSAWTHTVKPQLDEGKGWDQIIPTLDHDGLLAVQRFAPALESAKRNKFEQGEVPVVMAGIANAAERQVIASATGDAKLALEQFQQTAEIREAGLVSIGAMSEVARTLIERPAELARGAATSATIQVKRATFGVNAQPVADAA